MIYVTGDIHGEPQRFSTDNFPEQKEMTKDDFVIILGDFGLIWDASSQEKWWRKWLDEKPFTTLFIDGNHENFDYLETFPVVDFHGGKAHKISDSIYHLMRGYIFDICGKKFFAFGGASSHDIQDGILDPSDYVDMLYDFKKEYKRLSRSNAMFRVKGVSWWEQELPNYSEMNRGIESLRAVGNKVDYIISHCCPQEIAILLGEFKSSDVLTNYFNGLLRQGIEFDKWYFGHYHLEKQVLGKFVCLYYKIVRIV